MFNVCKKPLNGDDVINLISIVLVPALNPSCEKGKFVKLVVPGISNVLDQLTFPLNVVPLPDGSGNVGKDDVGSAFT